MVDPDGRQSVAAMTFGDETIWGDSFSKKVSKVNHINIPAGSGQGGYTDFRNSLISATAKDKNGIGFLAVFSHGGESNNGNDGNMIFANAHLNSAADNVYSIELKGLASDIKSGKIRFAKGAVIYLGACNAGTSFDGLNAFAQEFADVTGVKVIAMKDTKVGPVKNNSSNTSFWPYNKYTGQWHEFNKGLTSSLYSSGAIDVSELSNSTMKNVQPNPMPVQKSSPQPKSMWQKFKDMVGW